MVNEKFRLGVGMIICNQDRQVFWGKRAKEESWQFPQGGIRENEAPEEALYRELEEEIGLKPHDVQLLGSTESWLVYRWPEVKRLSHKNPNRLGQKQKWFLLRLISEDTTIYLHNTYPAEFEKWRWVDYWYPIEHVALFKRKTYRQALHELKEYQ